VREKGLEVRKKGFQHDQERDGPAPPLLEPTPDQVEDSRSLASTTNTAIRYNEITGGLGLVRQEVEHPNSM
jgi:hypothetical protein